MAWSSIQQVTSPLSGNRFIDSLVEQQHLTYNYELPLKNSIDFTFDTGSNVAKPGLVLETMSDAQKTAVRNALGYISGVTGIVFNEVGKSSDDLVFGYERKDPGNAGVDYSDYNAYIGANGVTSLTLYDTITLNANNAEQTNPVPGTDGYLTVLHEVGHALGLKHPFEAPVVLDKNLDNTNYTVMSYTNASPMPQNYGPIDIAALRWLYGGDGLRGQYGLTVDASGTPIASPPPNLNDPLVGLPGPDGSQVVSPNTQANDDLPAWQLGNLAFGGTLPQLTPVGGSSFTTDHKGEYTVLAQA